MTGNKSSRSRLLSAFRDRPFQNTDPFQVYDFDDLGPALTDRTLRRVALNRVKKKRLRGARCAREGVGIVWCANGCA